MVTTASNNASPDACSERVPLLEGDITGPLIEDMSASRSIPVIINYDVFLNHRGPDVKKTLVSHLCSALKKVNFSSFVDYLEIQTGDLAWETIESAIHHSKIHIAVFSPHYAESSWCLNELRLLMECFDKGTTHLFLPVFFNVTPSDLRLNTPSRKSCYNPAFEKHGRRYEATTINDWKNALHEASMVKGFIFPDDFQGFEATLVESIVSKVIEVLSRATLLHGPEHPVGVDEKLREALDCMERGKSTIGVQKLGIYGMGGLGKTTLAKSIYNRIHREFESACFMQSVSEGAKDANKGLKGLQKDMLQELLKPYEISVPNTACGKQMMRDRLEGKKVLIILDDVSEKEQLDELMPPSDCLLGKDSQIVITTRDQQVLMLAQAQICLPMEGLSEPLACELFNLCAFHLPVGPSRDLKKLQENPCADFKMLAEKMAYACQGLPLALEVLGSYLRGKQISEWEATMKVLETRIKLVDPQRKVTAILKISYDALLSTEEKEMFLDISCFLFQEPKDKGMRIWRSEYGDAVAELHLENLIRKCLVKLGKNGELTMHDLLRDMGREIVDNSHTDYWERSHLWREDDVRRVLNKGKGTSHVRGLSSNVEKEWKTTSFSGMDELKLLVLSNVTLTGDFSKISQELRWFQLRYCPLKTPLPLDEICLDNVAVLDLEGSKFTSINCANCMLQSLKELNLSNCSNLKELPVEFCKSSNSLETLILSGCVDLERMPDSVSELSSSLRYLDISGCSKLSTLPNGIASLTALTTLLMNNCDGLGELPEAIGQLTTLEKIGLDRVPLSRLPQSFHSLSSLVSLRLDHCFKLRMLPLTIGKLKNLTSLDIISCPLISKIPPGVTKLKNLVHFRVSDCKSIRQLPKEIGNLPRLIELHVHDIVKLVSLPSSISELQNLEGLNLKSCPNLCKVQCLPPSLTSLDVGGCSSLRYLDMSGCNKLKTLPSGIESLRSLTTLLMKNCTALTRFPDAIGQLLTLKRICLERVSLSTMPQSFSYLSNLVSLRLGGCSELTGLPPTMGNLKNLMSLDIISCPLISDIPQGVTSLTNLVHFRISDCESIDQLPENICNLWKLKEFHVSAINNMKLSVSRICQLQQLVCLELEGCNLGDDALPTRGYSALSSLKRITLAGISMSSLPRDFGNLPNLKYLILMGCPNLSEVPCLPSTLTYLNMGGCSSLERIPVPCLSSLTKLRGLVLCNCTQLLQLNGLECLCLLSSLDITGCRSLLDLPSGQLEKLTSLKELYLAGSGVSILQDNRSPWIQKMVSLEVVSIMGDKVPDYFEESQEDHYLVTDRQICMKMVVPKGDIACRGVLCCFVSEEHFNSKNSGGRNANTWVRAEVVGKGGEGKKYSQLLFYNRISDWTSQLHMCIFRASHPFVASLKGGDKIHVIAQSVDKLCSVKVRAGVVKLIYGENEMKETLQKLSLINKPLEMVPINSEQETNE